MDAMSIQAILSVSVPEYILSVMIGFLIIGEKDKLFKPAKFILTIFLMSIFTYFTRKFFFGEVSFLLNSIGYILIIYCIYRIRFTKVVLCVVLFSVILLQCEILYSPLALKILGYSIEEVFKNDLLRFQLTLPSRLIQIAIVISLWNINISFFTFNKHNQLRNLYFLMLFLINSVVESIFIFTYVKNIDSMVILDIVLNSIACFMILIVNILFVKFIALYSGVFKSKHEKELKELNNSIYVYKHKISKNK